jgi:UDP-N-acetylmuramate: L-alanyl-gamma-D-glutamyl-meso-diaminopimelate ligase
MGSIALLARGLGHTVTGTDENVYPPMSDQLRSAGIDLTVGYTAENIPSGADLVMIGNAGLPRGNPAVEHVLDNDIPYTSGAEWIGRYLLKDRWVIAVAGTHGKTTTTSMIAWILEHGGLEPGFLIGGIPANFPESARLGNSPFFVIEADEYDTSYFDRRSKFLHYHPRTAVLNNLEFDHADIFADLAAIQNQFHLLIRTIPGSGLIVCPDDDQNLESVFEQGCWTPRLTFSGNGPTANVTVSAKSNDGSRFEVLIDGVPVGHVDWGLTGEHNVSNALAAIAASRHVGVPPELACEALCQFGGVKRRMEIIYSESGLTVYDDFAHHPTAIRSTIAGLRHKVGEERILAIVEPGSHTMRKGTHQEVLRDSINGADEVIWFRPPNIAWSMDDKLSGANSEIVDSIEAVIDRIVKKRTMQHVVIMSNSGFGGLRERLLENLKD